MMVDDGCNNRPLGDVAYRFELVLCCNI